MRCCCAQGAALFLAGNVLQFASHWGLAQLSKQKPGYSIPSGGLFEWVSCPHYLAEIIIYLGLVLASQGQLMPVLMLVWVVSADVHTQQLLLPTLRTTQSHHAANI